METVLLLFPTDIIPMHRIRLPTRCLSQAVTLLFCIRDILWPNPLRDTYNSDLQLTLFSSSPPRNYRKSNLNYTKVALCYPLPKHL